MNSGAATGSTAVSATVGPNQPPGGVDHNAGNRVKTDQAPATITLGRQRLGCRWND
jgi:hypothetical protein